MRIPYLARAAAFGALALTAVLPARSAVTLTEVGTPTLPVNCWVLANDYLQVAVDKATGKVIGVVKVQGDGAGASQTRGTDYESYLDWVSQTGSANATRVLTPNGDGDDSDAKCSLKITGVITTGGRAFNLVKTYRLRDGSKVLETEFSFTNTASTDYSAADPYNGVTSSLYLQPGGSKGASDDMEVKTAFGLEAFAATTWFGSASGAHPELAEGWLSCVDTASGIVNVVLWPLAYQKAHSADGVSNTRGASNSNRFMVTPSFTLIKAGETLSWKQYLVIDDKLTAVSYADVETNPVVAGISLNNAAAAQGATVTATFGVNNISPTAAASYDIKNIRVLDSTGAKALDIPAITGINVAANAHGGAARQFTAALTPGNYTIAGDLYVSGAAAPISTLFSKTLIVTSADVKVLLYQDPTSGLWVLENEVVKAVIDSSGQIAECDLKPDMRNQANGSYYMFHDYVNITSLAGIVGYNAIADPDGTDTPTKKSLKFGDGYNAFTAMSKQYTLESNSRSLQVDFSVANNVVDGNTGNPADMNGQGFYSHVAVSPGGVGEANDQFSAHTAAGLVAPHTQSTRYWFGAKPADPADGSVLPADLPALDQGWMATTDTVVTDTAAISWDVAKQRTYSSIPTGGSAAVPMCSVYEAGDFNRHVMEAHFDKIPPMETLSTTMYAMVDTGYKLVGYAEGKRVLAGVWADAAEIHRNDALAFHAAVSNVGTTSRTVDLKSFRLVKDTGEVTAAGSDVLAVVLGAAARTKQDLSFAIPADLPLGVYTVQADLYEGGAKVTTLQSLPFNVIDAVTLLAGDTDGNGKVELADVTLALQIASGLAASDKGNVDRGGALLTPASASISIADAVAIARKVANP
ncbi:MAG TPA: hypothetical protein VGM37_12455 [Armatimonadota bacterium]|jgi:hypothetical protein